MISSLAKKKSCFFAACSFWLVFHVWVILHIYLFLFLPAFVSLCLPLPAFAHIFVFVLFFVFIFCSDQQPKKPRGHIHAAAAYQACPYRRRGHGEREAYRLRTLSFAHSHFSNGSRHGLLFYFVLSWFISFRFLPFFLSKFPSALLV